MYLVLLRHGQSIWNMENKFTGWCDVDLSQKGIEEAIEAGKLLKKENINFDICFTSLLLRANKTLDLVLKELNIKIETLYTWRLNERHYGALQGLNKDEMRKKYGEEQVHIWRRSYDVRPPLLTKDSDMYPGNMEKYKDVEEALLPLGESLKDTLNRTVPYYEEIIKKCLLNNKNCLVVAHGNSLRSIIKYIENINDEEIMNVEIPTGKPYVYELDKDLEIINKYVLE